MPTNILFDDLCRAHEVILFDAYGVLVDALGARPGAAEAIATLRRRNQQFLVVTNDASRSPERAATRFSRLGIDVRPENVLSSGMMIAPAIREMSGSARTAVVLGTEDSAGYTRAAGVEVVKPSLEHPADLIILADEGGYETLTIMNGVLSMVVTAVRNGATPRLLLANPDLIYPAGGSAFGFTAGALALMLESALKLVLGTRAPTFEILGKPSSRIFTEAMTRLGTTDAVMIGDQLHTDIAGALSVNMASALLLGGVSAVPHESEWGEWTPRYVMHSL